MPASREAATQIIFAALNCTLYNVHNNEYTGLNLKLDSPGLITSQGRTTVSVSTTLNSRGDVANFVSSAALKLNPEPPRILGNPVNQKNCSVLGLKKYYYVECDRSKRRAFQVGVVYISPGGGTFVKMRVII